MNIPAKPGSSSIEIHGNFVDGREIEAGHGAMLIQRVRQEGRGTNERESIVTPALRRRFRDLRQGPDGLLYVVTSDKGDKEPNTGTVMRIEPAN